MKTVTVAALFVVGCYDPTVADGQLRCSPVGQPCPDGYTCAADLRCWMHPPDFGNLDAPAPDGASFDAAPSDGAPPDLANSPDLVSHPDLTGADLYMPPTKWTAQNSMTADSLLAVWGSGGGLVVAVGANGAVATTSTGGAAWSAQHVVQSINFYGVWGSSPADIYAVGYGVSQDVVLRSTNAGASWSGSVLMSSGNSIDAVWGSGPNDVYVAGQQIQHTANSGGTWTTQTNNTSTYNYSALFGAAGHLFATHYQEIDSSTGSGTWTGQPATLPDPLLRGIWATPAGDHIYIVGNGGEILHSTGDGMWKAQTNPSPANLYAIWGSSASDLYAVGDAGTILHSTGDGTWAPSPQTVTTGRLAGIWGSGPGDIFVVGNGGVILHGGP